MRNVNKIIILLVLLCCFVLGGCTDALLSCTSVGKGMTALQNIEPHGDYTIYQGGEYTYKGETYSIGGALGDMRSSYGLKGNGNVSTYMGEVGEYNYTMSIGAYTRDDVAYKDVLIARTPRKSPRDISVFAVIKKATGYNIHMSILGNYLFFVSDEIYVYDISTLSEIKNLATRESKYGEEAFLEDEYFAVCQLNKEKEGYFYRIFDENLNEYNFESTYQIRSISLYRDYFIEHVGEGLVYNFKTNELLDQESALAVLKEKEEKEEIEDFERQTFTYNGIKYHWRTEPTSEEQSNSEDNGQYSNLVITNLKTEEEYVLTGEEFSSQASEIINAVDHKIYCDGILSENGEIYFWYYYVAPNFQQGSTPNVVFKYDVESGKLLYIGYCKKYWVTHVYEGKII